jgi:hypothetical protein
MLLAAELHVVHHDYVDGSSAIPGFKLQNGINGPNWTFYASTYDGDLLLVRGEELAGYFDSGTGEYVYFWLDGVKAAESSLMFCKALCN